jgi:sugar lactone lactonase YvrE
LIGSLGARGKRQGTFNAPTHLSFHNNELYVSDTLNFRVQIFNRAGDGQLMFGKLGLYVGRLTRPKGVAVGQDGRIYVVESYFDHLLIFSRDGQLLLPIGGTGNGIGEFYLPAGVWVDQKGRVMIADMFNGRIVVLKELPGENGS